MSQYNNDSALKQHLLKRLTEDSLTQNAFKKDVHFNIELKDGGLDRQIKIQEPNEPIVAVEGHFKFLEIENLLRQICFEMFEPMRKSMLKEAEYGRAAKKLAFEAKTKQQEIDQKVEKLLFSVKYLDTLDKKLESTTNNLQLGFQQQISVVEGLNDQYKGSMVQMHEIDTQQRMTGNLITRYDDLIQKLQTKQHEDREYLKQKLIDNVEKIDVMEQNLDTKICEAQNWITRQNNELRLVMQENQKILIAHASTLKRMEDAEEEIIDLGLKKISFTDFNRQNETIQQQLNKINNMVIEMSNQKKVNNRIVRPKKTSKLAKVSQKDNSEFDTRSQQNSVLNQEEKLQNVEVNNNNEFDLLAGKTHQIPNTIATHLEVGNEEFTPSSTMTGQQNIQLIELQQHESLFSLKSQPQTFVQQASGQIISDIQKHFASNKDLENTFQNGDSQKLSHEKIQNTQQSIGNKVENSVKSKQKQSSKNFLNSVIHLMNESTGKLSCDQSLASQILLKQNGQKELESQKNIQNSTSQQQELIPCSPTNQLKDKIEKQSADDESSEDLDLDSDQQQDVEDSNICGIDVSRFTKYKDLKQLEEKILKELQRFSDNLNQSSLQLQNQWEQFQKQCQNSVNEIDPKIHNICWPFQQQINTLLQARSQWRSDDERRTKKLYERFEIIDSDYVKIKHFVDTAVSPMLVCLFEQTNLQIAAEEQDNIDRQKIALYGVQTNNKIISPQQADHTQQTVLHNQKIGVYDTSIQEKRNDQMKIAQYLENQESQASLQYSLASSSKIKRELQPQVVKMDQECVSCSSDVHKITKLFKLACLGYRSGDVTYRQAVNLSREKLLIIRKFLAGQLMFIVRDSDRLANLMLSPRRVFDDMYVHFQSLSKEQAQQQAELSWQQINFHHDTILMEKIYHSQTEKMLPQFQNNARMGISSADGALNSNVPMRLASKDGSNSKYQVEQKTTQTQLSVASLAEPSLTTAIFKPQDKISVCDDSSVKQKVNLQIMKPTTTSKPLTTVNTDLFQLHEQSQLSTIVSQFKDATAFNNTFNPKLKFNETNPNTHRVRYTNRTQLASQESHKPTGNQINIKYDQSQDITIEGKEIQILQAQSGRNLYGRKSSVQPQTQHNSKNEKDGLPVLESTRMQRISPQVSLINTKSVFGSLRQT